MYLADIKRDDRFEGYLIVRSAEQRASANGKNYLDMTLADKSGSINAKMWDGTVQPPLAGSIVKVRATGNEFNGRMQLRVEKIRAAESRDAVDMSTLIPCAPRDPKEMLDEVVRAADHIADPDLRKITCELLDRAGDKLLTFPAANTRAHRHIQQAAAPLTRAHRVFRQRRRVHIRVDARRHTQRILERRHQWIIDPLFFRRFGDVAVSRRSRIQVKRAERADSQRLDVEFPDKIHNLRHGHIRRERLKTGALEHAALRIADRADHFGAARFQCANKHKPSSFLRPHGFRPLRADYPCARLRP